MTEPSMGLAAHEPPPPNAPLPRTRSELTKRIVTAAVLLAVAVPCTIFGGTAFKLLIAVVAIVAAAEWGALCVGAKPRREGQMLGVAAALCAMLVLWSADRTGIGRALLVQGPVVQWAALLGIVAIPVWMTAAARGFAYRRVAFLGPFAVGLASLSLIYLREIALEYALFALIVVWVTDIGAFFVGRAVGGPKLAPRVSPKKTWSGALGGVCLASIVGTGFGLWHLWSGTPHPGFRACVCLWDHVDISPAEGATAFSVILFAATGIVLSICGQAGDLIESWLKRRAGVKDSGRILPGHGGVLDRIDGLMLSMPLAALILSQLQARFFDPCLC